MLAQGRGRLGAQALRRAVGGGQLRMGGLEGLQFAEQSVELGIRDVGCVVDVVGDVGVARTVLAQEAAGR